MAFQYFLLTTLCAWAWAQEDYVVQVEQGLLRGGNTTSVTGFNYVMFLGVPYAEPPVGNLRFQPPVNKSTWDGVRDALTDPINCWQQCEGGPCGSEDCLYLNIYTPQLPDGSSELKKVMVFIHGGGFIAGDGSKRNVGPDFLVEKDIVLVTIQYRLGIFGFLSLQTELVPGNFGLKDQNLALQWIQRNIAVFGGDPNEVTIFGSSAGAASVHYHVLSPLSKGLFKQALAESGSALNAWAFTTTPRERAFKLGAAVGIQTQDDNVLLDFLKTADASSLVSHMYDALSNEDSRRLFMFVFVPCVEPDLPGAFLTEEPAVLIAEGRYNHVPYLTGITSAECNFFISDAGALFGDAQLAILDQDFLLIIGPDLRLPSEAERFVGAQAVKDFFFGERPITTAENTNVVDMLTDLYFAEGVDAVVRSNAVFSSAPLFYYRFSFKGSISSNQGVPGVSHGDETIFLFNSFWLPPVDPNSPEALTRHRMVSMWTNFAIYGNPIPAVDEILTTSWPQYGVNDSAYLDIGSELLPNTGLYREREDFWHSILP